MVQKKVKNPESGNGNGKTGLTGMADGAETLSVRGWKRSGTGVDLRRLGRGRQIMVELHGPAVERARRSLGAFAGAVVPGLERTPFHEAYFRLLEEFARGRIRRMMVSVPPQHGKSLGASVLLPVPK